MINAHEPIAANAACCRGRRFSFSLGQHAGAGLGNQPGIFQTSLPQALIRTSLRVVTAEHGKAVAGQLCLIHTIFDESTDFYRPGQDRIDLIFFGRLNHLQSPFFEVLR